MSKVHLQTKTSIHLYLLNFQNINMYSKGNYRVRIEATANNEKCLLQQLFDSDRPSELGRKENQQYFSQEFTIRFQNQKVQIGELLSIQSPALKHGKENRISIRVTLLKAEKCYNESILTQYTPLCTSYWIIRFVSSTSCEYSECSFQQPFLSTLSALILVQPSCISIETKQYKNSDKETLLGLKKEVKKMRYNSYLLAKKFHTIFYIPFTLEFTLPKIFVTNEPQMDEVTTNEQMFLNYLILYEQSDLTLEMMNYELISICFRNDELFRIFDENCSKNTIFITKIKMEFQEMEGKRYKLYVVNQEYKQRFEDGYKPILREKLKIINKEMEMSQQYEVLNNVCFKMESYFEEHKANDLPVYPIIVQQTLNIKRQEQHPKPPTHKKIRYILILAHGYQGSPDDLSMMANGFKKQYKKCKYLILKSYRNKMGESLTAMADSAVEEINAYLSCIQFKDKIYRIVMIGHSMGGLILRLASPRIDHQDLLYGYVSLGTPHLGYLQGLKLYIRAGLSLFSNLYSNPCLNEISGKDSPQLHETAIYKMSVSGSLANFRKVVLVASSKDKYVSWHSARLENMNRDFLKQYTFIENEMINNILGPKGNIDRVERLEVDFNCVESNMDRLIGRTSHIKMLTDCSFIELLCETCLPRVFDP